MKSFLGWCASHRVITCVVLIVLITVLTGSYVVASLIAAVCLGSLNAYNEVQNNEDDKKIDNSSSDGYSDPFDRFG